MKTNKENKKLPFFKCPFKKINNGKIENSLCCNHVFLNKVDLE
jgi:hypothetical protein